MISFNNSGLLLSPTLHNLVVILLYAFLLAWIYSVVRRILRVKGLYRCVRGHRAVFLRGLGENVSVLRNLAKNHVQTLLHSRQTNPAKRVQNIRIPAFIKEISAEKIRNDSKIKFSIDCDQPCSVHLFWDVEPEALITALEESTEKSNLTRNSTKKSESFDEKDLESGLPTKSSKSFSDKNYNDSSNEKNITDRNFSDLLEDNEYGLISKVRFFEKGNDQIYQTNFEENYFHELNLPEVSTLKGNYNLAIVIYPQNMQNQGSLGPTFNPITEECSNLGKKSPKRATKSNKREEQILYQQVSSVIGIVKFTNFEPNLEKQIISVTNSANKKMSYFSVEEVFGHNDDSAEDECVICLTDSKSCILIPCRHFCVCNRCFRHIDKCPICRTGFDSFLVVENSSNDP
mmetsp:Transcript_7573/g.11336  ORF Transcript_7573/g.11336 Transcript_7573/m.11336 type:complete len:402 (+) Transcript_7573:39-1244(+)